MLDPKQVAEGILGKVDWQNEVSGFCKCPGEGMHTSADGKRDCRVNIDGAPTIFCFHASCAAAVAEANRRLRRELGASPWELRLPGGQTLLSGNVLQKDGTVLQGESGRGLPQSKAPGGAEERSVLETLRVNAERFKPELFEFFRWPMASVLEDSPLLVAERDPEDQFRTWLKRSIRRDEHPTAVRNTSLFIICLQFRSGINVEGFSAKPVRRAQRHSHAH